MSADIATLGIVVDTSQVEKGTMGLSVFNDMAKRTGKTVEELAAANQKSQAAIIAQNQAQSGATKATDQAAKSYSAVAAANDNLYQKTLKMNQAAQAMGVQFNGVNTALALFSGGLLAVGAATAILVSNMVKTELQFDDTPKQANLTVSALHDLASAASFKGISNSDFLTSMQRFSDDVYQAQNGLGSLGEASPRQWPERYQRKPSIRRGRQSCAEREHQPAKACGATAGRTACHTAMGQSA